MLPSFLNTYPDIRVEITIDDGLTDIVASRYDAGIRFGEKVAKDMIAVRVGSAIRAAVVGSPAYFANHPVPNTPQDLAGHRCINYRFVTSGGLYPWEFESDGRPVQVRVDGPLVFNDSDLILKGGTGGTRNCVSLRRPNCRPCCRRSADPGLGRVVPDLSRLLLPLSSKPPPDAAGINRVD